MKLYKWLIFFTAWFLNEKQVYYNSKFLKKQRNRLRFFSDDRDLMIIDWKLQALEQVKKTRRNLYHV